MLNELIESLPHSYNAFNISKVSYVDIKKAISGLRNDCSTGPDKIPAEYFKLCVEEITSPLCHIINESIEKQIFPAQWKLSKDQSNSKNQPSYRTK